MLAERIPRSRLENDPDAGGDQRGARGDGGARGDAGVAGLGKLDGQLYR